MRNDDPAHEETDKILSGMEKELDGVYKQAYREAKQTADDFAADFREMDNKKRKQLEDGNLDDEEYQRWRRTKIFQSNRYFQMADVLAADMTHTNQLAASIINGYLPEIYALNHNYATYEVEHGSKINTQYTLYDRFTVERLLRDEPDLLPRKAGINVPDDLKWNKKNINSAITQGVIQGEDIDKISQRLAATVTDMSHTSAIRNARTMTTSAENGGRVDSYKRAENMGINMLQVWLATLDDRTRHAHRQLDGQKRAVGEPFEIEGEKIEFPGDPKAEPYLVYNCRCTLIGQVKGVNLDLSDVTYRDSKLGDMTYEEWKEDKQNNAEPAPGESVKNSGEEPKINKKSLDNGDNSSIIKSGARSGAYNNQNDPDNKKRDKSAKQYYEEMRNRDKSTEVKAISANTDLSIKEAELIFDHVFENEHIFADGTKKRFAPDYYMQQSFMRIREGKNIQQHDKTLLYHELEEAKLMKANPKMVYEEAHAIVEKKYNYTAELKKYLKKKGGKQ